MTTAALTLPELARMMAAAITDRSYQRDTRLGASVADYLAWKKFRAAERTLTIYEGYLARLCVHLAHVDPSVDEVTPEMLLEALGEYPRGSWRLVRTTYSDFFKWACRWGHTDRNPVDLLPPIPEPPMRVYNVFTAAEQAQLIKAADKLPLPWVQRLRVLCLLDLGLRKEEARLLQAGAFDPVAKTVVVRGKGSKERMLQFGDELWRAYVTFRNRPLPLVRMMDERGDYKENRPPRDTDYLFFSYGANQSGRVTFTNPAEPSSQRAMHHWWASQVIPAAGVKYRSMHMARHTVGTDLASAETDSFAIQDWLGHADPGTTKVYVHNSRARLANARRRLDDYRQGRG
jgi:integrase